MTSGASSSSRRTSVPHAKTDVLERARGIRLVALDVDGVLTDGSIVVFADGNEARSFHSRDGLAVKLGQIAGLRFAVISGRTSAAVERRARELGLREIHQGVGDKVACLREIALRLGITVLETCFVGDDLVDLPALLASGLSAAPADADEGVRDLVHLVTDAPGGRGAVREVIEFVLRAQGAWERVTAPYAPSRG